MLIRGLQHPRHTDLAGSFKYIGLRQDAASWIMQLRKTWVWVEGLG